MKMLTLILSVLLLPATVFASNGADYAMEMKACGILRVTTGRYGAGFYAQTESKWACFKTGKKSLFCDVVMGANLSSNKFRVTLDTPEILVAHDKTQDMLIIDKSTGIFLVSGSFVLADKDGGYIEHATCKGAVTKP